MSAKLDRAQAQYDAALATHNDAIKTAHTLSSRRVTLLSAADTAERNAGSLSAQLAQALVDGTTDDATLASMRSQISDSAILAKSNRDAAKIIENKIQSSTQTSQLVANGLTSASQVLAMAKLEDTVQSWADAIAPLKSIIYQVHEAARQAGKQLEPGTDGGVVFPDNLVIAGIRIQPFAS